MRPRLALVTAHSGCEDTPENSPESLLAGIAAAADLAEVDVRLSPSGIPILRHDGAPAEIATPDTATTLEAALDLVKSANIMLNLDLKDHKCIDAVVTLLRRQNCTQRVVLSGCGPAQAKLLGSLAPEIPVLLNSEPPVDGLSADRYAVFVTETCRCAIESRCCGVNIEFHACRPALVAYASRHYLPVSVWTVDEEHDMWEVIRMGVHSITTRRPRRLISLLESLSST